jgi:hypothetical protein
MERSRKDVPVFAIVRESAAKWRGINHSIREFFRRNFCKVDVEDELPNPLRVATTSHTDIYPPMVAEMCDVMLRGALEWLSTKDWSTILFKPRS